MSLVILIQSEYCNLERFKRGDYGLIIQTLKNKGKKRSKEFCLFFFFLQGCYVPVNYPVLSHSLGSAQIRNI